MMMLLFWGFLLFLFRPIIVFLLLLRWLFMRIRCTGTAGAKLQEPVLDATESCGNKSGGLFESLGESELLLDDCLLDYFLF
jgi:hypothetical protein